MVGAPFEDGASVGAVCEATGLKPTLHTILAGDPGRIGEALREAIDAFRPDVIVCGWDLPGIDGRALLDVVRSHAPDVPVIVVGEGLEAALDALASGAADYVLATHAMSLGPAVVRALRDGRERRTQRERLARAESFRHLLRHTLHEIYVFDADTMRFVEVNDGSLANLGYTRAELSRMTPLDLKPLTESEFQEILAPLRTGRSEFVSFATTHRRKDGSAYPVEVFLEAARLGSDEVFVAFIRDTTERERMLAELRASERRFHSVVDAARDAVIGTDAEGRIIVWNAAAATLFGYAASEMMGEPLAKLVPEDARARHKAGWRRWVQGAREPFTVVVEGKTRGGERVPFEVSVSSWEDMGEVFTVAVVRDIRERQKAERAVREAKAWYETLVERLPAVTYQAALEPDGLRITWISPQVEDKLGLPSGEWKGDPATFARLLHPEDRALVEEAVERLRAGAPSFEVEYRIRGADGGYRWMHNVGGVVERHGEGRATVLGVALDITSAREAERERRLLSVALEQAETGVLITDAHGVVHYVNPAHEHITGYSAEELLGRPIGAISTGEQPPEFYRTMTEQLLAGRTWTGEVVNRRPDGSLYRMRLTITPVEDPYGDATYYVGIGQDVTEERAIEARLWQAQKLEAVGQFTAGVAHDFNNVLTAILTNTELARAEVPDSGSEIDELLGDVEAAARRGSEMVRRLLTLSRDQHIEREVEDLATVVLDTGRMLERVLPETIELRLRAVPGEVRCLVDAGVLHEILLNLATNARDAMPDGGTLDIEVAPALRPIPRSDGPPVRERFARVIVRDSGVGMDAETLEHVFEPFFTTKPKGEGTGLGLAMVHGLMRQHGGHVEIESAPGRGTTVSLLFPIVEEMPAAAAAAEVSGESEPGLPTGQGTVLVVEDEESIRRAAESILTRLGYTVVTAEDGRAALDVLEEGTTPVDVVVTDLVMPRMTGPELFRATASMEPRPRFVFTSGYAPEEVREKEGLSDADVLRKPWSVDDLARAVHDALPRGEGGAAAGGSAA